MGVKIFQRHRICDIFNVLICNLINPGDHEKYNQCDFISKVLEAFLSQLESGYSKNGNPYHNLIHAADVVHTCNSIMEGSGLTGKHLSSKGESQEIKINLIRSSRFIRKNIDDMLIDYLHLNFQDIMTGEEKFAILFAALIHDFEHAGTTNAYQINFMNMSHLALLYNDRGVLENHHISAAYRVTQLPAFNIFVNVPRCQFQDIRRLVIEMVLNTDMSLHFSQIKTVNKLIKLPEPTHLLTNLSHFE
ncbi:hypothetical protein ACTXT7_000433 [Hymenolepis weldensis]